MRKVGMRIGQAVVGLVIAVCVSAVAESAFDVSNCETDEKYERDASSVVLRSLDDLLNAYSSQANSILPIALPDSSIMPIESTLVFDDLSSGWPIDFLERLKTCAVETADMVVVYEILIQLHPKTHAFQILSGRGELLWEVDRPKDYRTTWFSIEHFADQRVSREVFKQHCIIHNPARFVGVYTLINSEAAEALFELEELDRQQFEADLAAMPEPMVMMMGGGSPTNFMFTSLVKNTNDALSITIEWPTGCLNTNMVDFFTTEDLTEPLSWSIALTTNVNLSSNSFSWVDTISVSGSPRFYDVWTLDDTDGDTLSDGREVRMYGTDENDADTDDDGLDDGEEIFTYETNPLNSDSDADGLNDGSEVNQYGSDPLNSDSDGDGDVDPYEIYAVSGLDYFAAQGLMVTALGPLEDWAEEVYRRFKIGHWPTSGSATNWNPTSIGSVSFIAEQSGANVPYADLTHKFGATSITSLPEITLNGRRYPQTLATVSVYYWSTNTPVNDLFREDGRVEEVIKAFVQQIPYDELNAYYNASSATGTVRTIQWEFSMDDHHKLYWTEDDEISLTGGDDTLLRSIWSLPVFGEPLALGDVWVVGSDPANMLYGGGGYIELQVEKLPSGDLKINDDPYIDMTVEDMFDFNYWNDGSGPPAAASIQCAYGRKATGVGQVALLRFDVEGSVDDVGNIIIQNP